LLIHKRVIKPRLSPEIEELKTYQPVPKSITASIFLALIGLLIWLLVSQLVGFIIGGAALVFAIIAMNKVLEPNDNKRDYALAIVALILSILSVFGAFVVSYMLEFGQII
jgi:CDP-diglyceride synthetase